MKDTELEKLWKTVEGVMKDTEYYRSIPQLFYLIEFRLLSAALGRPAHAR